MEEENDNEVKGEDDEMKEEDVDEVKEEDDREVKVEMEEEEEWDEMDEEEQECLGASTARESNFGEPVRRAQATSQPALPRFYAYDIDPCLTTLTQRFPAINPDYFQQIYDNTFKPENLSKLANDFATSCKSTKTMITENGRTRTANVESDAAVEDIRDLPYLLEFFRHYQAILVCVTKHRLGVTAGNCLEAAMAVHTARLPTLPQPRRPFRAIRAYHIAFHKKRCILDVHFPYEWGSRDAQSEKQIVNSTPA